ncbi:MAG TPA: DNA translocase FtsK 4TM domain-containing protein, partial [Ancylobacter sp.]
MGGQTQMKMRTPRLDAEPARAARGSSKGAKAGAGKSASGMAPRAPAKRKRAAQGGFLPEEVKGHLGRRAAELIGLGILSVTGLLLVAMATWSANDPSFSRSSAATPANFLGLPGAAIADLLMQLFGVASLVVVLTLGVWGWLTLTHRKPNRQRARLGALAAGTVFAAGFAACLPRLGG